MGNLLKIEAFIFLTGWCANLVATPAYFGTWKMNRLGHSYGLSSYENNVRVQGQVFDLKDYPDLVPADMGTLTIQASFNDDYFAFTGAGSMDQRTCSYDGGYPACGLLSSKQTALEEGCTQEVDVQEHFTFQDGIPVAYSRELTYLISDSFESTCENLPSLFSLQGKILTNLASSFWKALKESKAIDIDKIPTIKTARLFDDFQLIRQ